MKLGFAYANTLVAVQPEAAAAIASHADAAGAESLWTVEHVVVPAGYESAYPFSRSGKMPGGEDASIPDPLIWLSFVAGHTTKVLLATGMLILPQRNPVITAKELATLDVLSGGRVILGAGVGWLREEFEALGSPFDDRGSRTDEAIEAMRTLWREPNPTHHGAHFNFDDARMWPKPVGGAIPIVIGGHSEPAARRAARFGDGFFPAARDFDINARFVRRMRELAEESGRDPAAIEVTMGGRPDAETVTRYLDLGVGRLVTPLLALDQAAAIETVDAALDAFRAAGGDS